MASFALLLVPLHVCVVFLCVVIALISQCCIFGEKKSKPPAQTQQRHQFVSEGLYSTLGSLNPNIFVDSSHKQKGASTAVSGVSQMGRNLQGDSKLSVQMVPLAEQQPQQQQDGVGGVTQMGRNLQGDSKLSVQMVPLAQGATTTTTMSQQSTKPQVQGLNNQDFSIRVMPNQQGLPTLPEDGTGNTVWIVVPEPNKKKHAMVRHVVAPPNVEQNREKKCYCCCFPIPL